MSENALATLGQLQASDTTALAAASTAGGFLPRVQLYGSKSGACTEGKIPIAHYGLTRDKDQIDDLGEQVEIVVLAGRVKAMEINKDGVLVNYDPKSDEYARIAAASDEKDSGCMFGPEYLIYVPKAQTFATFYMASKTARRVSPDVLTRMHKAAVLSAKLIKTDKYSWHGPVCKPLDVPTFEVPPVDEIQKHITTFLSPRSSVMEKDTDGGGRDR